MHGKFIPSSRYVVILIFIPRIHEIPIVLPGHGIFRGPIGVPKKPDAVDSLIENNKEVWDAFISHKFPPMLANGSAPLDGFRYFMIVSQARRML